MPRVSVPVLALVMIALATAAGASPARTAVSSDQPAPPRAARPSGADPRLLLPGDGAVPGWMRAEEPRLFNGKTLFGRIDGGAEEFLAHGFRALGVGAYRADSLEVVAEIYDLGTRAGAKAILDARTDSTARATPAVGEACVLDSTQVIFRRSRFYIAVTGFEAKPEVTAALRALADSIDARIRATGGSPAGK